MSVSRNRRRGVRSIVTGAAACAGLALLAVEPTTAETVENTYYYDALGRLVLVGDGTVTTEYSYDADGNMTLRDVYLPEPNAPWLVPGLLALMARRARRRR